MSQANVIIGNVDEFIANAERHKAAEAKRLAAEAKAHEEQLQAAWDAVNERRQKVLEGRAARAEERKRLADALRKHDAEEVELQQAEDDAHAAAQAELQARHKRLRDVAA